MLFVGGLHPRSLGEIQAANDPNALSDVAMHAQHLVVAGGLNQRAMKGFVQSSNRFSILDPTGLGPQPGALQALDQRGTGLAVSENPAFAQPLYRIGLDQDAQIVELVEALKVKGQHPPTVAKQDLDLPLLLQAKQGLAHRRARHAEPVRQFKLRKPIARHQHEIGQVRADLFIDFIGQRHAGRRHGGFHLRTSR